MYKKENFAARAFKGIGYGIIGEILCALMVSALIVIVKNLFIMKIVLALAALFITLGLYFNWAYNAARRDRDMVKFHGMECDKYMPLKMALTGPILSYICLIVLIISYCGLIPDIFNFYLLFNIYILPFVDSFTTGRTFEVLTVPGLLGIIALVLTQPLTIAVSYIVTYKDIDVAKLIFYKKQ